MWGEVEGDVNAPRQPYVPIWHDRWRPTGVSCQVPRVLSSHKLSSTASDPRSLLLSIDYPKDAHDSNLLLHCIELQQYVEEMQQMISSVATSNGIHDRDSAVLTPAPPPAKYWHTGGRKTWEKPAVCDPESNLNQPITGNLDSKSCHLLQRKGVAALSLLCGYEVATERSLDVVSGILGNFLERFTTLLKRNSEECQLDGQQSGSLDLIIEQTLHQFGMGSMRHLKDYWKKLEYKHSQLMGSVSQQMDEWEKTMGSGSDMTDRSGLLKSMKLKLNGNTRKGTSTIEARLPSPWVATTPALMGEEETAIASDINLENVMPLKTPDVNVVPEFSHLTSTSDVGFSLEFDPPPSIPSRKRSRSSSFANEV